MESNVTHEPVLLDEVLSALNIKKGKKYIDATLGAGGHTEAILNRGGKVLGIEADSQMLKFSEERLVNNCPTLVRGKFENIVAISKSQNFAPVDGVLMDLGISNFHYESLKRGFSFKKGNEPLDLRLAPNDTDVTAAMLLNALSEKQLESLFERIIGIHKSRGIIKKVLRARKEKPFAIVSDLQNLARQESAEIFLALRIAVNSEFEALESGLRGAVEVLKRDGVLVVISFHSLEDKLVVKLFREFEQTEVGTISTQTPIVPTEEEVSRNPKSRSALMRIFKKI